jgi:hypothetical protein
MIEELKAIGSFVGLLTGAFYFYDRLAKGRPIASLTIAKDGTRKLACIRISNPSAYDIAVTDATVRSNTYFLTENLETRSLVEGAAGYRPYFMLRPGEAKELVIAPLYKNNVALEVRPHRVSFWIWWQRGNATWLPQLPVWVLTSTPTIRKYGLERT